MLGDVLDIHYHVPVTKTPTNWLAVVRFADAMGAHVWWDELPECCPLVGEEGHFVARLAVFGRGVVGFTDSLRDVLGMVNSLFGVGDWGCSPIVLRNQRLGAISEAVGYALSTLTHSAFPLISTVTYATGAPKGVLPSVTRAPKQADGAGVAPLAYVSDYTDCGYLDVTGAAISVVLDRRASRES